MGVKNALAVVEQQVIDPAPQRGFVMSNSGCLHTRWVWWLCLRTVCTSVPHHQQPWATSWPCFRITPFAWLSRCCSSRRAASCAALFPSFPSVSPLVCSRWKIQQSRDTPWSILGWHTLHKVVSFRLGSTAPRAFKNLHQRSFDTTVSTLFILNEQTFFDRFLILLSATVFYPPSQRQLISAWGRFWGPGWTISEWN